MSLPCPLSTTPPQVPPLSGSALPHFVISARTSEFPHLGLGILSQVTPRMDTQSGGGGTQPVRLSQAPRTLWA